MSRPIRTVLFRGADGVLVDGTELLVLGLELVLCELDSADSDDSDDDEDEGPVGVLV